MRKLILISMLGLTNCAGGYDRLDPPTVDMRDVDPVKYNKDLADCTDEKRNASFIGSARIISDCMTRRAYNVTNPRT
jgi:hypothetical protein